jgi:hypothetical protein
MSEQVKSEEEKVDHETILKERRERRKEERLRNLNERTEWQKEYDEYLDWYEKEEAREQMMKTIDSMSSNSCQN